MAGRTLQAVLYRLESEFGISPTESHEKATLESLGLDSLHAVALMLDLESELGVTLGDLTVSRTSTLGDLIQKIDARLDAQFKTAA